MHQSWSGGLNWCNTPFSILDQVVTKIEAVRPEIVAVAPECARSVWFAKLRNLASRKVFRTRGMRIFEVDGKSAGPTRWEMYFFYISSQPPTPDAQVQAIAVDYKYLRIPLRVLEESGTKRLNALVDTGSEMCLVRTGFADRRDVRLATNPVRMQTANGQTLGWGNTEVLLHLEMYARNEENLNEALVRLPTWCFEATIKEDLIFSDSWCQSRGIEGVPPQHGLRCRQDGRSAWIPGADWEINHNLIANVAVKGAPWALNVDAGQAATKALRSVGYRVLSVGSSPASEADVKGNLSSWNFWNFGPQEFETIFIAIFPGVEIPATEDLPLPRTFGII